MPASAKTVRCCMGGGACTGIDDESPPLIPCMPICASTCWHSLFSCSTFCCRCAGSFASERMTTCATASGTPTIGGTGVRTCIARTSIGFCDVNGGLPMSISYATMPSA
jgi:hypothetical protein